MLYFFLCLIFSFVFFFFFFPFILSSFPQYIYYSQMRWKLSLEILALWIAEFKQLLLFVRWYGFKQKWKLGSQNIAHLSTTDFKCSESVTAITYYIVLCVSIHFFYIFSFFIQFLFSFFFEFQFKIELNQSYISDKSYIYGFLYFNFNCNFYWLNIETPFSKELLSLGR